MADSLRPPGGASPDMFRSELDNFTTNFQTENEMEMDSDPFDLEKSKTCDDNCCDHFCNCKCSSSFCQVRTDIQINQNQTVYRGEGWDNGRIPAVPYGGLGFQAENGVQALVATFASLSTDASPVVPGSVLQEFSVQPMAKGDQDYDQARADVLESLTSSVVLPGNTSTDNPGMMVRQDHNAARHPMGCYAGCNSISKCASNAAEIVCPHDMTGRLDKKYQKRHDAKSFSAVGRVFAILWHGSAGRDHGGKRISGQHNFSNSVKIYSHIRRMVVVKGGEHWGLWCVPVNTYQGRGVVKAGFNSSDIQAHSIVHLTAESLTKTTDDASHTAHKPQPSPAKMSPDDDDDDESYGFRSASTCHINCHSGIGNSQPGAWKAEIKKQNNQREQENQNKLGVDHLVLSEWRSVIARVCGHYSEVTEQEWPEFWKDMSASILMTANLILGATGIDLGPYGVVA